MTLAIYLLIGLLASELLLQFRFFRARYRKIINIRKKLSHPDFKNYTDAIRNNYAIVKDYRTIGYGLQPNSSAVYDYAPLGGKWTANINNIGIRHPNNIERSKDGYQSIILLGDSVTFGAGVNVEDTFGYKLREKVRRSNTKLDVLNFAAGGYSVIDNIENFFYRKGYRLNPVCVLYVYTIKSIFDRARTNDPATGFHIEKWPISFLTTALRNFFYGGKVAYIEHRLKSFMHALKKRDIHFYFLSLPALYNNQLYPDQSATSDKYPEAVQLQQRMRGKSNDYYIDAMPFFNNSGYRKKYRRNRDGLINNYEVHFSKYGHETFAEFLFKELKRVKIIGNS